MADHELSGMVGGGFRPSVIAECTGVATRDFYDAGMAWRPHDVPSCDVSSDSCLDVACADQRA
jgi:hypothetical protein